MRPFIRWQLCRRNNLHDSLRRRRVAGVGKPTSGLGFDTKFVVDQFEDAIKIGVDFTAHDDARGASRTIVVIFLADLQPGIDAPGFIRGETRLVRQFDERAIRQFQDMRGVRLQRVARVCFLFVRIDELVVVTVPVGVVTDTGERMESVVLEEGVLLVAESGVREIVVEFRAIRLRIPRREGDTRVGGVSRNHVRHGFEVVGQTVGVIVQRTVRSIGIETESDFQPISDTIAVCIACEVLEVFECRRFDSNRAGISQITTEFRSLAVDALGGGAKLDLRQIVGLAVKHGVGAQAENCIATGENFIAVKHIDTTVGNNLALQGSDIIATLDDGFLQIHGGGCGEGGLQQGRHTGDHRGCHGRTAVTRKGTIGNRAQDAIARCRDIDILRAIAGEFRQVVIRRRSRDGDNVAKIIAGRITRHRIDVQTLVTGSAAEQQTVVQCLAHCVIFSVIEVITTITAVRDGRAVLNGVANGIDNRRGGQISIRSGDLQRHDADIPVDARDTDAIVADRADDTRAMRAMACLFRIIHRIVVVIAEVITDERAVTIEDVLLQIRMIIVNTRIDHSHHDIMGTSEAGIPDRLDIDVTTRRALDERPAGMVGGALSGIRQAPLQVEILVVRNSHWLFHEVRDDIFQFFGGNPAVILNGIRKTGVALFGQFDKIGTRQLQLLDHRRADHVADHLDIRFAQVVLELDDQLAGGMFRAKHTGGRIVCRIVGFAFAIGLGLALLGVFGHRVATGDLVAAQRRRIDADAVHAAGEVFTDCELGARVFATEDAVARTRASDLLRILCFGNRHAVDIQCQKQVVRIIGSGKIRPVIADDQIAAQHGGSHNFFALDGDELRIELTIVAPAEFEVDALFGDLTLEDGRGLLGGRLDGGHHGPAVHRVGGLVLDDDRAAGEDEMLQVAVIRRERIQRVGGEAFHIGTRERTVQIAFNLIKIGDAVAVGIRQPRIEAKELLVAVGHIAGGSHRVVVIKTVRCIRRIRTSEIFIDIGQTIAIFITDRIIDAIDEFEPIGHAVAIGIVDAADGGRLERAVRNPFRRAIRNGDIVAGSGNRVGGSVLPARMREVFDGLAAIVEAEVADEASRTGLDEFIHLLANLTDCASNLPDTDFVHVNTAGPALRGIGRSRNAE